MSEDTPAFVMPKRVAFRDRLQDDRKSLTHHFCITDRDGIAHDGYLTVGLYEDGRPGELFIKLGKVGSEGAAWDWGAKMASAALQYGAPLENLCKMMIHTQYDPCGNTTNKDIPRCSSVEDYAARYLLGKFGAK